MTKPAGDGNNIKTMKGLVFHGPNSLALEDKTKADDYSGNGCYRANHDDHNLRNRPAYSKGRRAGNRRRTYSWSRGSGNYRGGGKRTF